MFQERVIEATVHDIGPVVFGSGRVARAPSSGLGAWVAAFRDAHARARAGELEGAALAEYRRGRLDLERSLLVAQQITREFGHGERRSIRLAWALQVDLRLGADRVRAATLDISKGGFSALLGEVPAEGATVEFRMRLPRAEQVAGTARLVTAVPRATDVRACFAFVEVPPADLERLESFMFDQILERLSA